MPAQGSGAGRGPKRVGSYAKASRDAKLRPIPILELKVKTWRFAQGDTAVEWHATNKGVLWTSASLGTTGLAWLSWEERERFQF